MATRVVLADDHQLIREGLRRAFEADGGFAVVAETRTMAETLAVVPRERPDVLVVDVGLPDGSGLDVVRELRAEMPELGIVVLTMFGDDEHLLGALDAGASAFVLKSAPTDEVLAAARHAASSPRGFAGTGLADALRRRAADAPPPLAPREQEVLALLADGLTVPAIARRIYVSESTAKTYVAKVYEKLGATNRSQALLTAVRLGLLPGSR